MSETNILSLTDRVCLMIASGASVGEIAKREGMGFGEVKGLVKEHESLCKEYAKGLQRVKQTKYERLYEPGLKVLKEILGTEHRVNVFDKEGNVSGTKIDVNILKMKKEVASELLESIGIKKNVRGGGIQINNLNTDKRVAEGRKILKMERNEIQQALDDCRLDDTEIKLIS